MIGKQNGSCAPAPQHGVRVMTLPNMTNVTDAQCEALFASPLQASDAVTAEVAAAEISRTIQRIGHGGCASRMAQEFGDHPEEACDRMRWVRHLIGELPGIAGSAACCGDRSAA
jgi:hypothetical protein